MGIEELVKRISFIRLRAGLSARELGLRVGKNESYISRLEHKRDFNPSIKTLISILEACNTSTEEFFYYDITQYVHDKEIIDLLKNINEEKKKSIIGLLK